MDETPQPRLGTRLRMARMRLELTQEQVAKQVGFVPTVYGRIERGDMVPSVPKLRELCLALGVSADVLLSLATEGGDSPGGSPANAPAESADLRRLDMLVRDLSPDRLRLFRVALQTIAASDEE
ncbi:helix-turn-helix transcriptional regulator [Archangium violaceum]|uniref:helix-turn-helix transcriptional regulator n=1 Tax=Archangium violaceum TaxID=83451 RepID=UPI00193B9B6E|nr:helix-turn-helix transcriptional regulator [Archangium violaceum]QRK04471.1 helix-turn-helix transcriptional regulator [Archangium violaceum]